MPVYAVAITPLLQIIKLDESHEARPASFANDLSGAGKLLLSTTQLVGKHGPRLGYIPRADKSWFIVKSNLEQSARKIFAGTDVCITTAHTYLGGYIGSDEGKSNYIRSRVRKWADQLLVPSVIAQFQPQAAYTTFVFVIDLYTIYATSLIFKPRCS